MPKFANTTLIDKLSAAGLSCQCQWQVKGTRGAAYSWIECWLVAHPGGAPTPVLIMTYQNEGGWEAFTPCNVNRIDATVADVIARTRRMPNSDAA